MQAACQIKEATPDVDSCIAAHFYHLWRDNAIPDDGICSDWLEITLEFMAHARRELNYKAFIAIVDDRIVGSTSCQLFAGLYPLILTERSRKYGYIWGVYVEPDFRHQGIAQRLTEQAIAYLKELGCTRATLHASPAGKPVYERLGFISSNEMRLDLS